MPPTSHEPEQSTPERELVIWRNPELAAEIREGLGEAERGDTVDLGSFARYDAADPPSPG